MTPDTAADVELERRAALVTLEGEQLGPEPLVGLLRDALDNYMAVARRNSESDPRYVVVLVARRFVLLPPGTAARTNKPVRRFPVRVDPEDLDVPNAALELWGACHKDATLAVSVLDIIEERTQALSA